MDEMENRNVSDGAGPAGNTRMLNQDGEVIAVERFTDVFILRSGVWMVLSAQETAT